jgi:hypothetical protein
LWNLYQVIPFSEGYGDEGEIVHIWKGGLMGVYQNIMYNPKCAALNSNLLKIGE